MRTAHTTGDAAPRGYPRRAHHRGVSTLFVYWFGVADRYAVFLYEHLGAGPFDLVTTSRYWMAGLVAGGMVTSIYTPFRALVGAFTRAGQHQESPDPLRIWALCALPLAVTIVGVTTRVNTPTLTLGQGVGCAAAALAALALALAPARWAVERPLDLVWLVGDGLGLVPVLLLLRTPELAGRGIVTRPLGIAVAGGRCWLHHLAGAHDAPPRLAPPATPRGGIHPLAGLAISLSSSLWPISTRRPGLSLHHHGVQLFSRVSPPPPCDLGGGDAVGAPRRAPAPLATVTPRAPRRERSEGP